MAWNVGIVPCGPPSLVRNTIPTFIPLTEAPCVTGVAFPLEQDRPAGSQRARVDQRFLPVSPGLPFASLRYHRSWRILASRQQHPSLARFRAPEQQPRAGQYSSSAQLTTWRSPRPVGRPFDFLPRSCRFLLRLNEQGNSAAGHLGTASAPVRGTPTGLQPTSRRVRRHFGAAGAHNECV
jgi:hypothetical protein